MIPSENSPHPRRPQGGWLRSVRGSRGLSLQAVADRLHVSPQAVHQFEKSEASGTISLRQLGNVAAAMGCRLTYAILPPAGGKNFARASRSQPTPRRAAPAAPAPEAPSSEFTEKSVEQSMLLQNQADGRFD